MQMTTHEIFTSPDVLEQMLNSQQFTADSFSTSAKIAYSIIIVNYNGVDYIGTCLDSVLAHVPDGTEIIVVDNASTDGSFEYLTSHYSMIRVINNPENGGYGQGNNVGIQEAKGEYLILINPDTIVTAHWLEPMIELIESDPTIGMVTPKILLQKLPNLINACGNDIHLSGLTLCRGALMAPDTHNEITEVSAVSGAAFVIRKSLFEQVGGFDPLLFMYMDDTDLSLRVRLAGYRCMYTPHSVIYHDYSLRFGRHKVYYQERNRYIMLLKTLRWRTLLMLMPAFMLAEMVSWGFVLINEINRMDNKFHAYFDIPRLWRQIMEVRKAAQSIRRIKDQDIINCFTYKIEFEQTGENWTAKAAHFIFDPLFYTVQRIAKVVIRW